MEEDDTEVDNVKGEVEVCGCEKDIEDAGTSELRD